MVKKKILAITREWHAQEGVTKGSYVLPFPLGEKSF